MTYNSQTYSVLSDDLLNFIREKKIKNIMTLPTFNADKIAYLTKKKFTGEHILKYLMKDLMIFFQL